MSDRLIRLRGVETHNLKQVDLDLPHGRLIVFCGPSGSGKTSMALDTLYAEGQRRYVESFSAYTRQYLEQLDKPAAESIDGIPPAIAVSRGRTSRSSRATIGTLTETNDYLRLLLAKIGAVVCHRCHREVRRDRPEAIADRLAELVEPVRLMIAFADAAREGESGKQRVDRLRQDGYVRAAVGQSVLSVGPELERRLAENASGDAAPNQNAPDQNVFVILDRLTAGGLDKTRLRESLETAEAAGAGRWFVFIEESEAGNGAGASKMQGESAQLEGVSTDVENAAVDLEGETCVLDGRRWTRVALSSLLRCESCGLDYQQPEPRLLSFNSPLGACPDCEGFGNIIDVDMDLVVPDPSRSLREGAIAPWNTPAYAHELEELLALADDFDIPVDTPYRELDERSLRLIREGVPERNFGGLNGFFAWLERRKYKMHLRVFLSRWRSSRLCETCQGNRLKPEALAVRLGGRNMADLCATPIRDAREFLKHLELSPWQRQVGHALLDQVRARLKYLDEVGVGYLTLARSLRTLSGGEAQRVALTMALGSSLSGMLYVLDEPSVGLHPHDVDRLMTAVRALHRRGNTLVVVEHEEAMIRQADQVVEFGPGAGESGGRVVFQGTTPELINSADTLTADWFNQRRGVVGIGSRREPSHGSVKVAGARGHNLQNITVEFPLGLLCLVTGVSGAGKTTLVQRTLYPALAQRLRKNGPKPLDHDNVFGDGQLDDLVLIDPSPIGRSPRSNPVTYIKAFDQIRAVFAETSDARMRNYTASHFSFNVDGGRCEHCNGDGFLAVDMQFMTDVSMTCPQCHGRRYRREILDVRYRGRNIAEILEMTVREAFAFFRGYSKLQARLKQLIDVGLEYLRLGQPANTLSGGESQRLKLASYLAARRRGRTLFLLDEPTTGLHFCDIVQLLDCFDSLLDMGHSLIVIEHNLQMMRAADYLIDLGPGAAEEGGRVVAHGSPEQLAKHPTSLTGKYLAEMLSRAKPAAEQTA